MAIEPHGLADGAHLVGEAGLQGVKTVVGVLDHLGDAQRHAVDGSRQTFVELGDSVAARLVAAGRSLSWEGRRNHAPSCLRAGTRGSPQDRSPGPARPPEAELKRGSTICSHVVGSIVDRTTTV